MISSASSGSSFQTERQVSGGNAHRRAALELDDLVVQLEQQLAGGDEVDLLLLLVPMPVRALAARVLRHPPVRERDLLGLEVAGHHPHLARVVAEDVVHVFEPLDRVVGHLAPFARRRATLNNAYATTPYVLPTNSAAIWSLEQVRVRSRAPTLPLRDFPRGSARRRLALRPVPVLGFGDEDAWLLVDSGADLQLTRSLVGAGCPLHLALRIVV